MSDLVDKMYDHRQTQLIILPHDLSDSIISGTCDKLTDVVYNLEYNIDGTDTTDYAGELTNAINKLLTSSNQDEQKVLLVSFCQSEDGDDDTFNVPSTQSPDVMVQIIVVNAGEDASSNDEFSCLVNDASNPKYIEYTSIDDGINDSNTVKNKVCKAPTSVPTPYPVDLMKPCDLDDDSFANFFVVIDCRRSLSNEDCTIMNEFLLNLVSSLSNKDEVQVLLNMVLIHQMY